MHPCPSLFHRQFLISGFRVKMDDPGHNTAPISTRTRPLPINQHSWDVESDFVFRGIPRPLQPEWIDVGEEFGALPSESELSGGKSTLYNILRQKPAFHPPFYDQLVNLIPSSPKDIRNSKVLNRTNLAISNWTITDPTIPRLEALVYAKNMFEDLAVAGRSRLEEDKVLIRYDKPRIWASLALLVPWYARRGLPTIIHCEKDVWEHFFHVIMLPAFHAHLATIAGTLDDEDLYLRFPFITSGRQGDHVIPDAVLATSKQEFKLGEVTGLKGLSFPLAVEVKCENVLTQTFRKTDENIFQDLRNPDGYAMKYRWPSTTLQKDNDTQSRVLCQVSNTFSFVFT